MLRLKTRTGITLVNMETQIARDSLNITIQFAKYFHIKCIFGYSLNNISNKFVWILERVSAVS